MHSNSISCPNIVPPPLCSSILLFIASDMYLEPESERWAENGDFYTAKSVQKQATLSLLLAEFLQRDSDLRPVPV